MSSIKYWNFRLVKGEDSLSLIEAFYDRNNRVVAWGVPSTEFLDEDRDAMIEAFNHPVLTTEDLPADDGDER